MSSKYEKFMLFGIWLSKKIPNPIRENIFKI